MPKHGAFIVEISVNNPEALDRFQEAMNVHQDEMDKMITAESDKLGVSFSDMSDIWYLRSRSRWTQEKEDYLIKLAKEGKKLPNISAED
jgi:hypothetical protein